MRKSEINIYDEVSKNAPIKTTLDEIEVGTVFRGEVGYEEGHFWKIYNTIVDLNDPFDTWSCSNTTVIIEEVLDMDIKLKSKEGE